jgi:amidase
MRKEMNVDDLCTGSLGEVAQLIAKRQVSPVEVTTAMLARIERFDEKLHSYLTVTAEQALAAARAAEAEIARGAYRGPLHGVPIGIKDLCATRGVRTTCGSAVFADAVPAHDATVVRRLAAAGAISLGKLNLTEFALMGYHPSMPRPYNPWDVRRDTGGSSSGSGAATAAGLCFGAIGTDTGGSIRMPSGWCGVVGLKPTYGRVSRAGVFPLGASLDHIGPMTRRVADAAAMLDAMAGFDPDDPTTLRQPPPRCAAAIGGDVRGVRIGWDAGFASTGAQPELVTMVQRAVQALATFGAQVVEVKLAPVEPVLPAWPVLCAAEAAAAHVKTFPSRAADYGPTFRSFLEYAGTLRAQDYAAAHEARINWAGELRGVFEQVDVLACPSTFMAAPPADLIDPLGPFTPNIAPFMRFTAPFNFSGSPTLSMPCGFSRDGLPYSLQLVGRHGDEALLCRIGHVYEQATEWHERRPPIS